LTGCRVRIRLTADERAGGVLIVGDRLTGLHNPSITVEQLSIRGPNGEMLETVRVPRTLRQLDPVQRLQPPDRIFAFVEEVSEDNRLRLAHGDVMDQPLEIPAYDIGHLLERVEPARSTNLIVEVIDWLSGEFRVRDVTGRASPALRREFVSRADRTASYVFQRLGSDAGIDEQLAYFYFLAPRELTEQPALSISEYVELSKRIDVYRDRANAWLWHTAGTGRAPQTQFEPEPDASLTALLAESSSVFRAEEAEAFVRDELFHGRTDLEAVYRRCRPGSDLHKKELLEALAELWQDVESEYNLFADQEAGRLRQSALHLLDRYAEWSRSLEEAGYRLESFDSDAIGELYETREELSEIVMSLNAARNLSPRDASEYGRVLFELEAILEDLLEAATPKSRPGGSVISFPKRPEEDGD